MEIKALIKGGMWWGSGGQGWGNVGWGGGERCVHAMLLSTYLCVNFKTICYLSLWAFYQFWDVIDVFLSVKSADKECYGIEGYFLGEFLHIISPYA